MYYTTSPSLAASCFSSPYYGLKILVTGKYRQSIRQKLGAMPDEMISALKGHPRIWVHAVSVGEVTAAAPIVAALRGKLPQACIVLSTGTETGQAMARKLDPPGHVHSCIFPSTFSLS